VLDADHHLDADHDDPDQPLPSAGAHSHTPPRGAAILSPEATVRRHSRT
jgi:hypothetical protein